MIQRRLFAFALFAVCGPFAAGAAAQDETPTKVDSPIQLAWKFKAGDKLDLALVQEMAMEMNVLGMEVKTNMDMEMTMAWDVTAADKAKGTYDITQTFKRMKMTMEAPAPLGKISFDSDAKEAPEGLAASIYEAIKPLIGAKFMLTLDGTGKVSKVSVDEETKKAFEANPQLSQFLSEDSLKSVLSQAGALLSEKPVKSGDSWDFNAEVKSQVGVMKMDGTNTLAGLIERDGRKLAKIDLESTIDLTPEGPIKIALKEQEAKGSLLFDIAAGRLAESTMVQKMTMGIEAGGMTIDQEINSTTRLKVMDAK